jgi:hypothetical protein
MRQERAVDARCVTTSLPIISALTDMGQSLSAVMPTDCGQIPALRCVVMAWMPLPCRPGCMVAASTSNAARQGLVRAMPV